MLDRPTDWLIDSAGDIRLIQISTAACDDPILLPLVHFLYMLLCVHLIDSCSPSGSKNWPAGGDPSRTSLLWRGTERRLEEQSSQWPLSRTAIKNRIMLANTFSSSSPWTIPLSPASFLPPSSLVILLHCCLELLTAVMLTVLWLLEQFGEDLITKHWLGKLQPSEAPCGSFCFRHANPNRKVVYL